MANNRLYIRDRRTGEKVLLCKSFGAGWSRPSYAFLDTLFDFLEDPDTDWQGAWGKEHAPTDLELITENEV